jgi:hypothetical protein
MKTIVNTQFCTVRTIISNCESICRDLPICVHGKLCTILKLNTQRLRSTPFPLLAGAETCSIPTTYDKCPSFLLDKRAILPNHTNFTAGGDIPSLCAPRTYSTHNAELTQSSPYIYFALSLIKTS